PTHNTVLFRVRLWPTGAPGDSASPVLHTPVLACTLSRTTGMPILPAGARDPFIQLLGLSDGRAVALLVDNTAVRSQRQLNHLIAIGRFGGHPALCPITEKRGVESLLSACHKRKMLVLDALYLDDDDSTDDEDSATTSDSDSVVARRSSSSSSLSVLKKFSLRRQKSQKQPKLASSFPDMDGATALDTVELLVQAGIYVPRSLARQAATVAAGLQYMPEELQQRAFATTGGDISPDRMSQVSINTVASSASSSS
ncbi:uncharacterized protein V1518DRAFT_366556, partial [Limtongia smithiae]|uniref:uncharacterized protein n=1 Tax=Limtongia smithiae TaxID=1125753 RepID=UPI0034CDAE2F